jgi:hypothetical protein
MDPSEKFLRFAAECEHMAQFTRTPENKTIWSSMAERWIKCAELIDRQSSQAQHDGVAKRHRKPSPDWAH